MTKKVQLCNIFDSILSQDQTSPSCELYQNAIFFQFLATVIVDNSRPTYNYYRHCSSIHTLHQYIYDFGTKISKNV